MKRISLSVAALTIALVVVPAEAGLRQLNPARAAPLIINSLDSNGNPEDNEYPWFSNDGKLMLWTRQTAAGGNLQWVWVGYIKNRDQIAATGAGQTLPSIDMRNAVHLDSVNDWVKVNRPGEQIKSIAVCEEPYPSQPERLSGRYRYRFTLYMSVGKPNQQKLMYRAHRVFVVVSDSTFKVTKVGISSSIQPVIPYATRPGGGGANETEPMLTRDGTHLFWASNAFNGGNMARFMGPSAACSQIGQAPKLYSQLSSSRFAWKDQYASGATYMRTSKTNYHTVIEKPNGQTALIFTGCDGQTSCNRSQMGNRECECQDQSAMLSTTGFGGGNHPPTLISSSGWTGQAGINTAGRATHPAIAGPQRSFDKSWLLFFMRGKKIWYTKIAE